MSGATAVQQDDGTWALCITGTDGTVRVEPVAGDWPPYMVEVLATALTAKLAGRDVMLLTPPPHRGP